MAGCVRQSQVAARDRPRPAPRAMGDARGAARRPGAWPRSITRDAFCTVLYPAPDLAAAKAWWTGFLGVDPYFGERFSVGYSIGGYELGLLPTADPSDGALTFWGVTDVAS